MFYDPALAAVACLGIASVIYLGCSRPARRGPRKVARSRRCFRISVWTDKELLSFTGEYYEGVSMR